MPAENTPESDHTELKERERLDPRIVVSVNDAAEMTGKGTTWVADRVKDGKFRSLIDGGRRMIFVSSIYSYLHGRIDASYATDGSLCKVRQTSSMYRKQLRPRTQAELNGLAKANAARHREAQKRKRKVEARKAKGPAAESV